MECNEVLEGITDNLNIYRWVSLTFFINEIQPDEDNHAPNEKMMVDWFMKSINTSIV